MDNGFLFSISDNTLPNSSSIFNRILFIWETDPMLAYALAAIVALCIIITVGLALFLNTYSRQKANLRSARELLLRDEELREVKDRLERIINTAPLAFMLTIDGAAVEANQYIGRTIGIKPGDMVLPIYTDLAKRADIIEKALTRDIVENTIIEFHMLNGEEHRFLTNVKTVEYGGRQGFIMWAMDIEELERRKDQLHLARENLQTLLDMLPVPIRICTADGNRITYANKAVCSLFKVDSAEDFYGTSIYSFLPQTQPDGRASFEIVDEYLTGVTPDIELLCMKADGELFDCHIISCAIDYGGVPSRIAVFKDLTAEKYFERMLRETADKEIEANKLKSRFLVNMSHEIRTPMNAIIGLTEIELRKSPAKDVRDIYTKINSSAKNLLNIINDILDLSKIEADKFELYDDEFELEEVIGSALLVASPRIGEKDVEFLLNISLGAPRFLIGDRTRLWQILKNFLDNAAKFTEAGKIVLTVTEDPQLSDNNTAYMRFLVEDTGIGIEPEQLRKLFVPYTQIYNDAQKRYTGSGLGMAISKRLCELMGGNLHIDSMPGSGTKIFFAIPFRRSQKTETECQAVDFPVLRGLKVLAVDDNNTSLEIMESLFKASGASCETARSGEEALSLVFQRRDSGQSFDLIILDYMMGGISGLETARRIHSGLSDAPRLLMVTAYQRLLLKEDLQTNGIDDIIEKPFIPSAFIRKVSDVISGTDTIDRRPELPWFDDVRVLLCEDYFINQEVACGIFAQFGLETSVAENGKEGFDRLNSGESFDLVFMDLQMPVMDGYEAAKLIRSDPRFADIPIISLTADAMKEVVELCTEAGMNDHITKPIEIEHVRDILLKWLPTSKRAPSRGPLNTFEPESDPVEEAVRRFGGNRELYEKSLLDFALSLPEQWPAFPDAVQNLGNIRSDVHKIKGAAGNLSERELFQSAELFESSISAGSPDRGFYERFTGACAALKARAADNSAGELHPASAVPWTIPELLACFDLLESALSGYDPRKTMEAVKLLRSRRFPDNSHGLLKLCKLASNFEFDAASSALLAERKDLI